MLPPLTGARVRRVTAEISPDLYAALVTAKLESGKSLSELMREGLTLVAQRHRHERLMAKVKPELPPVKES